MASGWYTLFDTGIGICGIVWRTIPGTDSIRVIGLQLPEATGAHSRSRIESRWNAAPAAPVPRQIREIIRRIRLHFSGKIQDFQDVDLDLDQVTPMTRRIYEITRSIPPGQTRTYKQIAEAAGSPSSYRNVGSAMGKNPVPLIIPCHRVLAAGLKPGGFSAYGGVATKEKMLALEGVAFGRPATIRSERDLKRLAKILGTMDPRLKPLLDRPIRYRLGEWDSPYHTLLRAVVHQQLSPKAAKTILARVMGLFGGLLPDPESLLGMEDQGFRAAGLSRSKTRSLKDIASRMLDGTIPSEKEIPELGDEEIISRLTSIFGVGRWTVEMLLIFTLGRTDVFPVDDLALRKNMMEALGVGEVPTPKEARALGEGWRPYRTVATLYLWGMKEGPMGTDKEGVRGVL